VNFDGQQTGQTGIHARFESALVSRFGSSLRMTPPPVRPVTDVTAFMFDAIVRSESLVEDVLRADRDAARGGRVYDEAYFGRFFGAVRPIVERQMSEAASALASLVTSAWTTAGRPALTARRSRP
jgi:hypothetical protein